MPQLGLLNILTVVLDDNYQDLFTSFIMTEDSRPITEEDGDELIRENL